MNARGYISLRASNICLEEDEEEDMVVILEGFFEKQREER